MKKILLAVLVSTMFMAASATEKKDNERWNKGFKPKTTHKKYDGSSMNTPGYHQTPKAKTPAKHSNPVQNNFKSNKPEGTNASLGYLR